MRLLYAQKKKFCKIMRSRNKNYVKSLYSPNSRLITLPKLATNRAEHDCSRRSKLEKKIRSYWAPETT